MSDEPTARSATVGEWMTPGVHSIGADQTLELAALRMAELHVHDLPVVEAGQPVGVLNERDIELLRSVLPTQAARLTVEEAMCGVPYCVAPGTSVAAAARHMALRKLASALVVEHGRAVGVFTASDALALLAQLLEADAASARAETPRR